MRGMRGTLGEARASLLRVAPIPKEVVALPHCCFGDASDRRCFDLATALDHSPLGEDYDR